VLLASRPGLAPAEQLQEPLHAVLSDFGLAEVFSAAAEERIGSGGYSGTPPYMSPEAFKGSFSERSDIWSLGVVLFQLMTGQMPYRGCNLMLLVNRICCPRRHPPWELLAQRGWSVGARWFCQQLLCKDESRRPSASMAAQNEWLVRTKQTVSDAGPKDELRASLQQLHLQSHMTRMALHCITSQLNLPQLHQLNRQFRHYDRSGDGSLSRTEMQQLLEDVGITSKEVTELIVGAMDGDQNGSIGYSEFIAGSLHLASDGVRRHLRAAFDIFDLDGSGAISLEELRQVLTAGPNASAPSSPASPAGALRPGSAATVLPDGKTVESVMRDMDTNGTGRVEFSEFERYLLAEHDALYSQRSSPLAGAAGAVRVK